MPRLDSARAPLLALGFLSAACLPGGLHAQGPPGGPYDISVRPAAVSFTAPGTAEFNRGYAEFAGVEIRIDREGQVRGGPPWVLEVRADDASLGGDGKPASDLRFLGPDGGWTPLTTSFQAVAEGRGPGTVTTDFRVRLAYEQDRPGLYGSDLTFRLSRR